MIAIGVFWEALPKGLSISNFATISPLQPSVTSTIRERFKSLTSAITAPKQFKRDFRLFQLL